MLLCLRSTHEAEFLEVSMANLSTKTCRVCGKQFDPYRAQGEVTWAQMGDGAGEPTDPAWCSRECMDSDALLNPHREK